MAASTINRPGDRGASERAGGAAAILAEIAGLRAEVRAVLALLVEGRCVRRDSDRDARVLAAIALAKGAEVFAVADLLDTSHRELRACVHGMTGRQLGALLKHRRRIPIAPYVIHRIGKDEHGTLWALTRTDSALRHAAASPSGAIGGH